MYDLKADLSKTLDHPTDLDFLHYGIHYATNAFADRKRAVIVGMHPNRNTVNQALYMAASGDSAKSITAEDEQRFAKSEMQHNLLQAASRGSLRKGVGDQCGKSIIYLIAPPSPDPEQLVRDTFPGCVIEEWMPFTPPLKGQSKALIDVLDAWITRGAPPPE